MSDPESLVAEANSYHINAEYYHNKAQSIINSIQNLIEDNLSAQTLSENYEEIHATLLEIKSKIDDMVNLLITSANTITNLKQDIETHNTIQTNLYDIHANLKRTIVDLEDKLKQSTYRNIELVANADAKKEDLESQLKKLTEKLSKMNCNKVDLEYYKEKNKEIENLKNSSIFFRFLNRFFFKL